MMTMMMRAVSLIAALLLGNFVTGVGADGHEDDFDDGVEPECSVVLLTEEGKELALYSVMLDSSFVIGNFPGRNPIRDMDIDFTTGNVYGLQGNVPNTNTRLVSISLADASRVTQLNFKGLRIMKMAFNRDGDLYVQDHQGVLWSLIPTVAVIGNPGVLASALTFTPDGTLLLLQERDPGRFFMWDVNITDGSASRLGKVKGLGSQSQGAQVSFATSMFYNSLLDQVMITTFRQPIMRMFATSVDTIVAGGFATKMVPRTREVALTTAGFAVCPDDLL